MSKGNSTLEFEYSSPSPFRYKDYNLLFNILTKWDNTGALKFKKEIDIFIENPCLEGTTLATTWVLSINYDPIIPFLSPLKIHQWLVKHSEWLIILSMNSLFHPPAYSPRCPWKLIDYWVFSFHLIGKAQDDKGYHLPTPSSFSDLVW